MFPAADKCLHRCKRTYVSPPPLYPSEWCVEGEIATANFGEFLFRDCPKRVRGACPVALQSTKTALFDPFLPPSTSKFALRALFVPLFGQSQKKNSRKSRCTILHRG